MKPFRVETIIHSHKSPIPVYQAEEAVLMGESAESIAEDIADVMTGPTHHEYMDKYDYYVLGVYETDEKENASAVFKIHEIDAGLVSFASRMDEEIESHSTRNMEDQTPSEKRDGFYR